MKAAAAAEAAAAADSQAAFGDAFFSLRDIAGNKQQQQQQQHSSRAREDEQDEKGERRDKSPAKADWIVTCRIRVGGGVSGQVRFQSLVRLAADAGKGHVEVPFSPALASVSIAGAT